MLLRGYSPARRPPVRAHIAPSQRSGQRRGRAEQQRQQLRHAGRAVVCDQALGQRAQRDAQDREGDDPGDDEQPGRAGRVAVGHRHDAGRQLTPAAARERRAQRDRRGRRDEQQGDRAAVLREHAHRGAAGDRCERSGEHDRAGDDGVLGEDPAHRRTQQHSRAAGLIGLRAQRLEEP
jgi:hypothetical protein